MQTYKMLLTFAYFSICIYLVKSDDLENEEKVRMISSIYDVVIDNFL